jgi:hypothetical protein
MKWILALAVITFAATFAAVPKAHAGFNCWYCAGGGRVPVYCASKSGIGGCGCKVFYKPPYNICATCGGCAYGVCLKGCPTTGIDLPQAAGLPAMQIRWSASKTIIARIKLQSTSMSALVSAMQDRWIGKTGCMGTLQGRLSDASNGASYDWYGSIGAGGAILVIHSDDDHTEMLTLTNQRWTFVRDKHPFAMMKQGITEKY